MTEIIQWFGDSANAAFATFVVSVAAFVFSVIALFKTKRADKRLLEIEEERESDRKRTASRAQLIAYVEESGKNSFRLVIENTGESEARDIELQLDGMAFEDHQIAIKRDGQVNQLGPHSKAARFLAIACGCTPQTGRHDGYPGQSCHRTTLFRKKI